MQSKAMIVILSAPSGGGKTSISNKILEDDANMVLSISVTTRKPRSDEKEAVHYYFKTIEEFQELKANDEFLEYAKVYGNFYGTPNQYVARELQNSNDVLFDIDHQGAQQIKQKLNDQVVSIFIVPPSLDCLRERLESRGQDSRESIEKRLKMASEVMSYADDYDYTVVNDDFNEAVVRIQKIIQQERIKRKA